MTLPALDKALALAARELPSFPCNNKKRPTCPNGFKNATAAPVALEQLWQRYPGPLVGVPTGPASGLFVLDVDTARHDTAIDWLERYAPYFEDTHSHLTRSSGVHVLFRHRPGLKNTASKLACGVDTRGEGGYIIWWPEDTALRPLADVPQWLVDALVPPPPPPRTESSLWCVQRARDLDPIIQTIACAPEGQRNDVAYWGACRLAELWRAGRIGSDAARSLVVAAATHAGLSRAEAERTANSAFKIVGVLNAQDRRSRGFR